MDSTPLYKRYCQEGTRLQQERKKNLNKLTIKARNECVSYRAKTEYIREVPAIKIWKSWNVQVTELDLAQTSGSSTFNKGTDQFLYAAENSMATSDLPSTIVEIQAHLSQDEGGRSYYMRTTHRKDSNR